MFRKLILSGLAAAGLSFGIPGLSASQAEAREFERFEHRHHHVRFAVYFRHNCHGHWRLYGEFREEWEARRAEHHLRHEGFESYMREI